MKHSLLIFFIAFLFASCDSLTYTNLFKPSYERVVLSELQCEEINSTLTPQMVDRNIDRYTDYCIQWSGKITSIQEIETAFLMPVPSTEKEYMPTSVIELNLDTGDDQNLLPLANYILGYKVLPEDIQENDEVLITGKILGLTERENKFGGISYYPMIGVLQIEKLKP